MKIKNALFAAATALAWLSMAVPAQAWELVGTKRADHIRDRDVIRVRGSDRHRAVRFCVTRASLTIQRLQVVFANGGKQEVALRTLFTPGTCSRAIDLRGNRRDIRRVVVVYSKLLPGKSPEMRVFAR